jgi:predicted Rossmann fold nucleotide-binding protein DprA/Smf involved in DNA uptake
MAIAADSQVLLMLCSYLGLPAHPDPEPLTLREWNPLARKLAASPLKRPAALLGQSVADLMPALDLAEGEATRLVRLLERGGALAIEVERLRSLGIWTVTRADPAYPARLRQRLKESAPAVLFGSGEMTQPGQPGLAVVGSRNVDERGRLLAEFVGEACARCGLILYSGGARGVDSVAMGAALEAGGRSVGVLAESLEKATRPPEARAALARGALTLITPYAPNASFSIGLAMGRNKLIYALADYALVVASDAEKGGTWAGANEALKARWAPLFVREAEDMPEGNRLLLRKGALPFPDPFPGDDLGQWLANQAAQFSPGSSQLSFL